MYTCRGVSKATVLKVWSVYPWGFPSSFQDVFKVRIIFIETSMYYLPFSYVDICIDILKAMIGKTGTILSWVKAVALNYIESFYSLPPYAYSKKKVTFNNVLNETVKVIHFIISQPLSTCLLSIPCDKMGSMHKELLHTEI